MKVAVLGVLSKPITTDSTGGTEVFCALLAQGLAKRGHDVFLFATPQSNIPGVHMVHVADKTRSDIRNEFMKTAGRELTQDERGAIDLSLTNRLIITLLESKEHFDVIHDNTSSYLIGSASELLPQPIITTMHMPPTNSYIQIPPLIATPKNYYVAISEFQEKHAPVSHYFVYNGIDITPYPFNPTGGEHMVWIGRVSPNALKGLKESVIVAKETGRKLIYAANISDQVYFDQEIAPHLGPHAEDIGVLPSDKKQEFLANARVGLFPIMWEEPFGFVFVECLAVGTPVIAFARGAVAEIVVDGVTGFIVNPSDTDIRGDFIIKKTGIAGIHEAIERVYGLSPDEYKAMRAASRKRVEDLFTVEKMIEGYENVYKDILSKSSAVFTS